MTVEKKTQSLASSEIDYLKMLEAKINMLEEELKNQKSSSAKSESTKKQKLHLDDSIPVMSLLPYSLNLSTKEGGQGNVKKFTHFGEIKKILYKDLIDIMEVNSNFMQSGYFYILSPDVIREHGLDEIYSKILTKEKIDEILQTNSAESVSLYESANDAQKEIIISLLIEKIHTNPDSVDFNMIDRISRAANIDIRKKAQEESDVLKDLRGTEETNE
jgi:hypothetical protein